MDLATTRPSRSRPTGPALAAISVDLLTDPEGRAAHLEPTEARRAVASLLRSVADNIARVGPERALTGPIARGDAAAVSRHLEALSGAQRDDCLAVSRLVLRAARRAGLGAREAAAIEALLVTDSGYRTSR